MIDSLHIKFQTRRYSSTVLEEVSSGGKTRAGRDCPQSWDRVVTCGEERGGAVRQGGGKRHADHLLLLGPRRALAVLTPIPHAIHLCFMSFSDDLGYFL